MTTVGRASAMHLKAFNSDLELTEFDVVAPEAGALTADVTHAGVCGTDVHLQQGRLPIPLPMILGHEAVGRVRELGAGSRTDADGQPLIVGDHISWASNIPCRTCFYCSVEHEPSLCESRAVYGINQSTSDWPHLSGGWSEQIYLQPGSTVIKLPSGASPEDVIALGCAGPTATHALRIATPQPGDVVVVQGSGPVGLALAMLAKLSGAAKVILIGGPAERLDTARNIGVGDVHIDIFDTSASDRLELVRRESTGQRGADMVIEATGVPAAVAEGIDMTRRGGTYLVVGQYTDHGPTSINPHFFTQKQLRVFGSWAFSPSDHVEYVKSVPDLVKQFDLSAIIGIYPLSAANTALEDMRTGKTMKAVLVN